jgi:hypothetical protein
MDALRYGPQDFPPENRTLLWPILQWQLEYLRQPDGPNAGGPWIYTPEQLRFCAWWWAIDDHGRFVYRRAVLRRCKGAGKRSGRCINLRYRVHRALPIRGLGCAEQSGRYSASRAVDSGGRGEPRSKPEHHDALSHDLCPERHRRLPNRPGKDHHLLGPGRPH